MIKVQVLGAVLSHGPERDVLPARTIVSCVAVKQILVPAAGAIISCACYHMWGACHATYLQTYSSDADFFSELAA